MIPKSLGVEICNSCRKKLIDSDYQRCGVILANARICIDYKCSNCKYDGRYMLNYDMSSPVESLLLLAGLLEGSPAAMETKGISGQLDKIVGIDDLLRLGGQDGPREQPPDNLP